MDAKDVRVNTQERQTVVPDFKLLAAASFSETKAISGIGKIAERQLHAQTQSRELHTRGTKLSLRPSLMNQSDAVFETSEKILDDLGQNSLANRVGQDSFLRANREVSTHGDPHASLYSNYVVPLEAKDCIDAVAVFGRRLAFAQKAEAELRRKEHKFGKLTAEEQQELLRLRGVQDAYREALSDIGFESVADAAFRYAEQLIRSEPWSDVPSPYSAKALPLSEIPEYSIDIDQAQLWVDVQKLQSAQVVMAEIRQAQADGVAPGEYLRRLCDLYSEGKESFAGRFDIFLSPSDIEQIQYEEFRSKYLSDLAEAPVAFPFFSMPEEVFDKVLKVFGGFEGKPGGVCLSGYIDHPFWRDMNLLLAAGTGKSAEFILEHESRHGIDTACTNDERQSYDRLIGELFAYYGDYIVDGQSDWDGYRASVGSGIYYKSYSETSNTRIERSEWDSLVRQCVGKLKEATKKNGYIAAQRSLVQCKTIPELLEKQ